TLADKNVENDALFGVFTLDAEILEVTGVPERIEIAFNGDRIVSITYMREHSRQDGLLRDTAVADDPNGLDGLTLGECETGGNSEQQYGGKTENESRNSRFAGNRAVHDLHRAGVLRRAQVLVRSKVRLHGKNMHTLTA